MTVLQQLGDQVRSRLGIHLGPQKAYLLEARLERLRVQEGYADLETFQREVEAEVPRALDALARHLTTNHTFFFREPGHFPLLVELLQKANVGRPRIWSAAGSTGEEGYTLAMVLAEAGFRDFLVLVSDVNRRVVAHAHRGVFDPARIERIPAPLVQKYFNRLASGDYLVGAALRDRMRFRCLNLVEDFSTTEAPDVIFCRNLLIYFDTPEIALVLDRLASVLKPGGWLFLGQSEGIHQPPRSLRRVGPSVFQKAETA